MEDMKAKLLKEIDKILILFEGIQSKKILITRVTKKINDIQYNDQFQKFIADCYNCLGDLVDYESVYIHRKEESKKIRRCHYSEFKLLDHFLQNTI